MLPPAQPLALLSVARFLAGPAPGASAPPGPGGCRPREAGSGGEFLDLAGRQVEPVAVRPVDHDDRILRAVERDGHARPDRIGLLVRAVGVAPALVHVQGFAAAERV